MKSYINKLLVLMMALIMCVAPLSAAASEADSQDIPAVGSFTGVITEVRAFYEDDQSISADKFFVSLVGEDEAEATFLVSTDTFRANGITFEPGTTITGYYDNHAPMTMIYPPQYNVIALSAYDEGSNIKIDVFDENLLSSDGMLVLNSLEGVQITDQRGEPFEGDIAGRALAVYYGISTRSIPAQTTPDAVIVMDWESAK